MATILSLLVTNLRVRSRESPDDDADGEVGNAWQWRAHGWFGYSAAMEMGTQRALGKRVEGLAERVNKPRGVAKAIRRDASKDNEPPTKKPVG